MKEQILSNDLESVQGGAKIHLTAEQMEAAGWTFNTSGPWWFKKINGVEQHIDYIHNQSGADVEEELLNNPDWFPVQ